MTDFRAAAAAVLGVGLGILFLIYPEAIIRVQTVGRLPHDRGGEYGTDSSPERWRRLVQLAGVVILVAGLYFGGTVFVGR